MHHFGEDMTKGRIVGTQFVVEARHHTTGATVTLTGPTTGVGSNANAVIDDAFVENLARQFAHFLRENLNPGQVAVGSR